jgi:hypothetical protein
VFRRLDNVYVIRVQFSSVPQHSKQHKATETVVNQARCHILDKMLHILVLHTFLVSRKDLISHVLMASLRCLLVDVFLIASLQCPVKSAVGVTLTLCKI